MCHTDLVPDSGANWLRVLFRAVLVYSFIHVTTTATGDSSMPLFSFCLYSLVILLFLVNFCVVHVDFRRRLLAPISGMCVIMPASRIRFR